MIKAKYPENLMVKLFESYDPKMNRLDYRTKAIQQHKNRVLIGSVVLKHSKAIQSELDKSYTKLDKRDTLILKSRYQDLLTLKQCSKIYNVSIERVRQLESRACEQIKNADGTRYFNIFWGSAQGGSNE